jgi:hypothetical protein
MAAGLGFKDFTTGEVLTAADVDGYLMQGIWVFASTAARDAAVTSPSEGNFAFTKDTNSLWYYDGAAWVASGATGDIEGVTAGIGISGGGTSGTVTVTNSMATAIDAKGDLIAGTGADTFAKLTVGANGTTLTADSSEATGLKWATASGSGDNFTLLNSGGTALTGAATVTVSGISGKDKIVVIVDSASSASASSNMSIRFNTDTGANYAYAGNQFIGDSAYAAGSFVGFAGLTATSMPIGKCGSNAASLLHTTLFLTGGNSTGLKMLQLSGGGTDAGGGTGMRNYNLGGFYNSASTISSVSVVSGTGNFDGGTVYVYTSA